MKILVADDHEIVRRGITEVLREKLPEVYVGEASGGWEALRKVYEDRWDALILDVSMPQGDGLEVLQKISLLQPKLPVLVFTLHSEAAYAIRVFKSGASGFLNKSCDPDEIAIAIQKLTAGGKYVTPSLAERIIDELMQKPHQLPHELLSNRELNVMLMMGLGKSASTIANELGLSDKTISTYRERLLQKLGLHNTFEIIRYTIEHQLDNASAVPNN